MRKLAARLCVCALLCLPGLLLHAAAAEIHLAAGGWFRTDTGELYVPLGGFHGNEIPVAMVALSREELRRLEPHLWSDQKTAGQGHIDLWDASDDLLRRWFRMLARNGITAVRLFPRARVGADVLDLCGKLNPELASVFHRAFAAARPYHIRFLLQIVPEPWLTGYVDDDALKRYVRPRYSREELASLIPAQRRFLLESKQVQGAAWFTDPDVLACQKRYLAQALDWIAGEPQVFALELYNEQGWGVTSMAGKREHVFAIPWEDQEIRWTAGIVSLIKQRLPGMPVTISHPGHGLTGFDPLKWSRPVGVDFYSSHLYAGLCGENAGIDFAAITGATAAILRAGVVNFPGEWGVLDSSAPEDIRRRAHRDALWLSLTGGAPGFMQWTYEFLDEYRWAYRIFRALPKNFFPQRPELKVAIGDAYRGFQNNTRYSPSSPGQRFPGFPFNPQRRTDESLRRMLAAYWRSLEGGAPVAFVPDGGMPLEEFLRAQLPASRPLRAAGGYQLSYLEDRGSRVWLGYLRSRRVQAFGKQFLGVPVAAPLRLSLHLPAGRYTAHLLDLSTGKLRRYRVNSAAEIQLARSTDDDYVLLVASRAVKFRP